MTAPRAAVAPEQVEAAGTDRGPAIDVAVVVGLLVAASVRRYWSLPTDGLWFDDAWVAAGALHGGLSQLPERGSAHPGFTLLLQGWDGIVGGGPRTLAVPALVASALGPPIAYLALRRLEVARAVAGLLAAVLVVSDIHAMYAGRVKSYTLDTTVVLVLAAALPTVAARRWSWRTAAAWLAFAMVAASMSGYLLVATAIAIAILALHPVGDRPLRLAAVAAQAALQGLVYATARRATDLDAIEEFMEFAYDGHLTMHWNPVTMGRQLLVHLGRIVDVYPGGPVAWLAPVGIVALAGLALAATGREGRPRAVTSRFLLACFAFALVGGILDRFPFGPATRNWSAALSSPGGRHSLWLVPVFVVGLGFALDALRRRAKGASRGFDIAAVGLAAAVLVVSWSPTPGYMDAHSVTATRFAEEAAGPDGLILNLGPMAYMYASVTDREMRLIPTPQNMVGYSPVGSDGRVVAIGEWATLPYDAATLRRLAAGEERIVVYGGLVGPGAIDRAVATLESVGFTATDSLWIGNDLVVVLDRDA